MNNFAQNVSSELIASSFTETQESSADVLKGLSFNTVASSLGENKTPPPSLESRGGDMAVAVTQVEFSSPRTNDLPDMARDVQEKLQFLGDGLSEEINEGLRATLVTLNDIDGDGIPDDWDKNPGETVANVAARINKIGKYAITDDNKTKIFSALKSVTKSLDSLLNKISAMTAAASSSYKPVPDALASDTSDGDENPFSLKKVDKEHK
ncbi:MAG: hypothetical protein LBC30_03465 [Puniceicoccales bacterium]|jgi:hypothetical protein|nr:hypothetical protein [Puniceicoccales bacterium]